MKTNKIPYYIKMDHQEINTCPISSVHPDILQTHILTCLDGPTLMAAETATSQLRANDSLWANICHTTWPSTTNTLLRHVITLFPFGYRSFYTDSSSTLCSHFSSSYAPPLSPILISAVDIYYKNKHILSKVLETGTESGSCRGSCFHVELLDPTEHWTIPRKFDSNYLTCESELENNLTLSWILIDPTQARAANLTSVVPVRIERNWTTWDVEDLEVHYGTILCRNGEFVECRVVVTCEGWANEDLRVKQVSLEVVDTDENKLGWTDSLVVLHEAINSGVRRNIGSERKSYDEFADIKRKRKLWTERRRKVVEILINIIVMLGNFVFVIIPVMLLIFKLLDRWLKFD